MHRISRLLALGVVALMTATPAVAQRAPKRRTENVVLIVTDGLRWQELFRGAEHGLINARPGGVSDTTATLRAFWRDDPQERRRQLFPFLWGEVATRGVLIGNQDVGSIARVTNTYKFSYPGYSELFTGFFDPRIDSNEYPPNPNVTVFEWLARQRGFAGKVGAVGTWDVFHNILNAERSGIDVLDGWDDPFPGALGRDPRRAMVNALYRSSLKYWDGNAFDAPMQLATKEYIRLRMPRLLFVGYGETDEWAHSRRYDLTLEAARGVDANIAELWQFMQGMRQYRGRTTFIITTDHGRGRGGDDWTSHGESVSGAEEIWVAVLGPDTPNLGEVRGGMLTTQSQLAATIAALLGYEEEYRAFAPQAAASLQAVLTRR